MPFKDLFKSDAEKSQEFNKLSEPEQVKRIKNAFEDLHKDGNFKLTGFFISGGREARDKVLNDAVDIYRNLRKESPSPDRYYDFVKAMRESLKQNNFDLKQLAVENSEIQKITKTLNQLA